MSEVNEVAEQSLLLAYDEMLAEQVRAGRLSERTKGVRMLHANRLLEACLRSLSPQALEALVHVWFPGAHTGGGYTKVIEELQDMLSTRRRLPRRPVR